MQHPQHTALQTAAAALGWSWHSFPGQGWPQEQQHKAMAAAGEEQGLFKGNYEVLV